MKQKEVFCTLCNWSGTLQDLEFVGELEICPFCKSVSFLEFNISTGNKIFTSEVN